MDTAGKRTASFIVEQTLPSERLDAFLRTRFPAVSRVTLKRLIEGGDIRVNGQPVKATHHPRQGEKIEVRWPEPKPSAIGPEEMPLNILYEDEDLIVLDKPPGLVVHPAEGHEKHTLVNGLLHHCQGRLSGIGGVARPGIVHRLDKDTSGCLVVAKSDPAHTGLAKQFADRTVEKVYHALVCGGITEHAGEIRAAIARHPSHRKRMAVTEGRGRDAWTSYRVLDKLRYATWVEAVLHTGRTHQIRVHFHHLGTPLVGDTTYGSRQNGRLKELAGYVAPRQMLHARTLAFAHPCTDEPLTFEAPLPRDFLEALAALRKG
ncbi:MAG: RluA family pseudouridine synthase [Verrucomicrobia bacterium]|nr:RluA family pseudouridine synthase [Verrucomicrobiota bacterium]